MALFPNNHTQRVASGTGRTAMNDEGDVQIQIKSPSSRVSDFTGVVIQLDASGT